MRMQTLAHSAFLRALGGALVNSVWQMGLLWLLYLIVTVNTRRFTASIRHSIAIFLLTAGTCCFIFSFSTYCTDCDLGISIIPVFFISAADNFYFGMHSLVTAVNQTLPYAACGYLLVLMFHLGQYSRYFCQSYNLTTRGLQRISPQLRLFAEEVALHLGISKKVRIFLSELADSPMTIGFLKYIILIPLASINNLSTQQAETVLLHELAHIRRNDYLVNLLVTFVDLVFFFNPFSRLFVNTIKKERENSCDDLVLQFKYDAHTYVSALLSLEKSRRNSPPIVMAATGRDNKLLLQRVRRITGQRSTTSRLTPKFSLALLFFAIVGLGRLQFKLIPSMFSNAIQTHVRSSARKQLSPADLLGHAIFVSDAAPGKSRPGEISGRVKHKTSRVQLNSDGEDITSDENLDQQANQQTEDEPSVQNDDIVSASQSEPVDFSIEATPEPASAPSLQRVAPGQYPYVPQSSFNYQDLPDTSTPDAITFSAKEADVNRSVEMSLKAIGAIDWTEISRELVKEGKSADVKIKRLKSDVQKSLTRVDWKRISRALPAADASQLDPEKLSSHILMQLEALIVLTSKNPSEADKLERQVRQNQLRLRHIHVQEQQKLLPQFKNVSARKVIYI